MVIAGLDIGTSSSTLAIYNTQGRLLYKDSKNYHAFGTGGERKLNISTVKNKVKDLFLNAVKFGFDSIDALAISSIGESMVFLDKNDQILSDAIVTGDGRGQDELQEIVEKFNPTEIMQITGLPPNILYSLPKCLWLKKHSDVLKKTDKVFLFEDYFGYCLTGMRMVSYSSAARSMAFDIKNKKWNDQLLNLAGLSKDLFSIPVSSGTVLGKILPKVAEELGLKQQTLVIVGAHDQAVAALGAGLVDLDTAETGMGTCQFTSILLPEYTVNDIMLKHDFACMPYILEDTFFTSIEITTCGSLKNWYKKTFFAENDSDTSDFFKYIDDKAKDKLNDLIVLPQFGSAGNPHLRMDADGIFYGLNLNTSREEIYRAILESFALQTLLCLNILNTINIGLEVNEIIATGGGAQSALNLQIMANVLNKNISSSQNVESGTIGCFILAGFGIGIFDDIHSAVQRFTPTHYHFRPDKDLQEYYQKKSKKYNKIYENYFDV